MMNLVSNLCLGEMSGSSANAARFITHNHFNGVEPQNGNKSKESTAERLFPCNWEGCGKRFIRKDHLKRHLKIHTGGKDLACAWESCVQNFNQKGNLPAPAKPHPGEDLFTGNLADFGQNVSERAELCVQDFVSLRYASMHFNRVGQAPNVPAKIKYNTTNNSSSTEHEKSNEENRDGEMQNGVKRSKKRRAPAKCHTGERSFVCHWEGCGKRFIRNDHLKRHLKIHTGEKLFACDWMGCGMRFVRSDHMKKHRKSHSG